MLVIIFFWCVVINLDILPILNGVPSLLRGVNTTPMISQGHIQISRIYGSLSFSFQANLAFQTFMNICDVSSKLVNMIRTLLLLGLTEIYPINRIYLLLFEPSQIILGKVIKPISLERTKEHDKEWKTCNRNCAQIYTLFLIAVNIRMPCFQRNIKITRQL